MRYCRDKEFERLLTNIMKKTRMEDEYKNI